MAKSRKWIQESTSAGKKGALHRALGIPENERIPDDVLEKAAKQSGKTGQRARWARTVRQFHAKRRAQKAAAATAGRHASVGHIEDHVKHERTQKLSEHEKTIELAQKYSKETPSKIRMLVDVLYSTARKLHHYDMLETSVRPLSPRENQDEQERWGTVKKVAQRLGATKTVHGDPRGYTVKLQWPGKESNDWSGDEWGIV